MISRVYMKLCNAGRLTKEIINAGLPKYPDTGARFYGVITDHIESGDRTQVLLFDDISQGETDVVDSVVTNHIPMPETETYVIVTDGPNFVVGRVDKAWVIPNGETINITKFCASGSSDECGRVTLFYDPDGDAGTNMVTIDAIYVDGSSDCHDITNASYSGNGTRRIVMRRETCAGPNNMFARWEGNY